MQSCSTRMHICLLKKKTRPLVEEEGVSQQDKLCSMRTHVFLFGRNTWVLVEHEDMSSCSTRRRVFLFKKKRCLLVYKKTCLLADQKHMSNSCSHLALACLGWRPGKLSRKATPPCTKSLFRGSLLHVLAAARTAGIAAAADFDLILGVKWLLFGTRELT